MFSGLSARNCLCPIAALALVLLAIAATPAAVLEVDDDLAQAPDAPFQKIGAAMAAAMDGDEIVVHPGRYVENIRFEGRNVRLRSVNPADPAMVEATLIDGRFFDAVVTFRGDEATTASLEGFTLRNGLAQSGGGIRGSTLGPPTRATIRNNIVEDCQGVVSGGGIDRCQGLIEQNIVRNNLAPEGGGIALCSGTIRNNFIEDNFALNGGGLASCGGVIERNVIQNNAAVREGGGIYRSVNTIRDNQISANTGLRGAGLAQCNADLLGNTITENIARERGGGLYLSKGVIEENFIHKNSAPLGGGLAQCSGRIAGNTVEGNIATTNGGGLYLCSENILANLVAGNRAAGLGGGLDLCSGRIEANTIQGNLAESGGGVARGVAEIYRNRIVDNIAESRGGGIHLSSGRALGNLIAGNTAGERAGGVETQAGQWWHNTIAANRAPLAGGLYFAGGLDLRNNIFADHPQGHLSGVEPASSASRPVLAINLLDGSGPLLVLDAATTPLQTVTSLAEFETLLAGSRDNLRADPAFAAPAARDFRLTAGSPAIDRASLHAYVALPAFDLDGLGRMAGDAPDLGCLEFAAVPDRDGDGLADAGDPDPDAADSDLDGLIDGLERFRAGDPLLGESPVELTVPADFPTVQEALLLARTSETVRLAAGVYLEGPVWPDKQLKLAGLHPVFDAPLAAGADAPLPGMPAPSPLSAALDAFGHGPVLRLPATLDESSQIRNLVIRNGLFAAGAAIDARGARAALRGCLVEANRATSGAPIDALGGTVESNWFADNRGADGGVLGAPDGPVAGNIFTDNQARDGAAIFKSRIAITGNTFARNIATRNGGAIYDSFGPSSGNLFANNSALFGGAIELSLGAIDNNTFTSNTVTESGGAINRANGAMIGNHFTANDADFGGAIANSQGVIAMNSFEDNRVFIDGGAVFGCTGPIRSNDFQRNRALAGGAVSFCSDVVEFNAFSDNLASRFGGALATCSGVIRDNRFERNRAESGGALYNIFNRIERNVFLENTAALNGGAADNCLERIEANTFERNTAGQHGGAVHNCGGAIRSNIAQGNLAAAGGAFYQCNGLIENNLLLGNQAGLGGAIAQSTPWVRFNTIAGNHAATAGGGLHDCAASTVTHNIFWQNTSAALWASEETARPKLVTGNLFWQNSTGLYVDQDVNVFQQDQLALIEARIPGWANNLAGDPDFTDPLGPSGDPMVFDGDFTLRPGSAALDRAQSGPASDLAGMVRPLPAFGEALFDLGAYEFFGVLMLQPSGPVVWRHGETVEVSWSSHTGFAGNAVRLELWSGGLPIVGLGNFTTGSNGQGSAVLTVPSLPPGSGYRLRAVSLLDERLAAFAPGGIEIQPAGGGKADVRNWHLWR